MAKRAEASVIPPVQYVQVNSGQVDTETPLPPNYRGLRIGVAGTLNVTMQDGTVASLLPMFIGDNPGLYGSIQISTAIGSAENVWYIV